MDLNLENVTGNVITLEIAKRELMYGWDMCKDPEGYTWNKSATMVLLEYNTKTRESWKTTGIDGTVAEDSWK